MPQRLVQVLASDRVHEQTKEALDGAIASGTADGTRVAFEVFERQDYGIALPDGSPLREPLNRVLLDALAGDRWQALLERYLGPQ